METKNLYGIAALFDTPDQIIHTASTISGAGYRRYDINTPYPVHGMDNAMKLKASTLGYIALILGIIGASSAVGFMWWATSIDYPLVIGGKPFFSLPAFIPIIFEVTVLLASVGTVIVMLFIFFRLPSNSHPVHDTPYMKKVSVDKFGVVIEARDKLFDADKVTELLKELHAGEVFPIYFEEYAPMRVYTPKFIVFLVLVFIIVSGTTYFSLNKLLYMPPFTWMMIQPKLTPQSTSSFFSDGQAMRMPVEGTVSRGNMPYPFEGEPEKAGKFLSNPLTPTKQVLELGQRKFNTYCSPCHGYFGKGDSRLDDQFPNPPSLQSEKLRTLPDGQIFHIITTGQNLMPSYAKQVLPEERWAIIHYIRSLQRATNAKEEDVR